MKLSEVSAWMESAGMPGQERQELEDSSARFPDGSRYRYELSAIEHADVLEAMVDEASRRGVVISRVNAFFQGGILYDKGEIRAYARLAAENGIEVLACPGPRLWWDIGRQNVTAEGARCGVYSRGSSEVRKVVADIMRLYECGMRGFLLVDDGLLDLLRAMREQGNFPKDVTLKVSASSSPNHGYAVKLMEKLGATSVNPGGDLTLPIIAGLRKSTALPLDVFLFTPLSLGGVNRFYDAPEIARIASPVYFRIDPAPELTYGFNQPWASDAQYIQLARKKVKYAQIVDEIIAENGASIEGPKKFAQDLKIPRVEE
jgi:hypothetical protein